MSKRLFIFAGEPSGDLHGSHLVKALRKMIPDIIIEGVAGSKMRDEGVITFLPMEDFEVMGFSDVIFALPRLYCAFHKIKKQLLSSSFDAVVLIDYTTFNLKMAKALRKEGYTGKIIQYVCPSVWAWGANRIDAMAKTLDLLLCIYPFEPSYFSHTSLPAVFVGNPIAEYVSHYKENPQWLKEAGIPEDAELIALFPGSRKAEIERNLPIILDAALRFHELHPHKIFGISSTHPSVRTFIEKEAFRYPHSFQNALFPIQKKYTYELMSKSSSAIAKSGTVTLELALFHCPTVVIYKLSLLNKFYAKYILKLNLPHYCIVNILRGTTVFPELIEKGGSPQNLFQQLTTIDSKSAMRKDCLEECQKLSISLSSSKASEKAAEEIVRIL